MNNKLGGPRTEQGKARSSQNATRHGLRSNKYSCCRTKIRKPGKRCWMPVSKNSSP